ncbi:EF-P lysine aminoacylase EpmA [Bacterioplanoides sp. SCSIO 12839]|uniref:EF-P lysine aminoacylase EpmA n=1 Tax=Bacterioplanoides sp. SCSIO 12839 TaxID=2829569 RepID=UPI002104AD17|nr:EF-P lysine aminoacylase EpmA [Bacterioplanoides sp. SCSIO 12839]UTW47561.1 EF-P lysine aminoacylase GenX [Bacterioplanoides sp. SCSIO 12839]
MTEDWLPGASLQALRLRAEVNTQIRNFFAEQGIMEVETPLLCQAPVTDPNIEPIAAQGRYLHTSPEYAMKRLLCAGSGDIYQLCKVFRQGEAGQRHNPEFTMLEWYRVGWDHHQLMKEVERLLQLLLAEHISLEPEALTLSYAEALQQFAGINWPNISEAQLREQGIALAGFDLELNRDGWLDVIMSHQVEPALPKDKLVFIHNYPASQAALAKVSGEGNNAVAQRFEVYLNGVELANGYHELTDAKEQRRRFMQEANGRDIDERLLAAMEQGLPECAGVAMGIDRLLMLMLDVSIDEVLSFSWSRA